MNTGKFVDVDAFQRETSLEEAAELCGVQINVTGSGRNVRLDCPFGCDGDHAGKAEIAVDTENPAKQWVCHAYSCQVRGNLLTLMYGWLKGTRPSGDRLRGSEFGEVKQVIAGTTPLPKKPTEKKPDKERQETAKCNPPIRLAEKEETRKLLDPPLWEKLVREPVGMTPEASAYVRRHRCLSPEAMEKWHVGVLPSDGGGDKRGWSLRGHIVYPVHDEDGEVICFVGRDPKFEEKLRAFEATPPAERDPKKRPIKHKFPRGFHRGIELFGQQQERFGAEEAREALARFGLIVCEGFNDVIHVDSYGLPAVAIMSNIITDQQVEKLLRLAKELSGGKVSLLFDCDLEGDNGAKDAAWKLLQAGLHVVPRWGPRMYGGAYNGRQPESLTAEELTSTILPGLKDGDV